MIVQRLRLHSQKAELVQKVAEAEAEGKRLRAEIKALDGDRKAIEKVAGKTRDDSRGGDCLQGAAEQEPANHPAGGVSPSP